MKPTDKKPESKKPTPEEIKAVCETFKKLPPEERLLYVGIGIGLHNKAGLRAQQTDRTA